MLLLMRGRGRSRGHSLGLGIRLALLHMRLCPILGVLLHRLLSVGVSWVRLGLLRVLGVLLMRIVRLLGVLRMRLLRLRVLRRRIRSRRRGKVLGLALRILSLVLYRSRRSTLRI